MQGSVRSSEVILQSRSINWSLFGNLVRADSPTQIVRCHPEPALSLALTLVPPSISHCRSVETLINLSILEVLLALSLNSPTVADFKGFDLLRGSEQRTRSVRTGSGAR